MDVAIIGAGLAGLSCAHELEKYGIYPVIYERNAYIGEPFPHCTVILNITHRPIKDSLEYFEKDLGISISPQYIVNSIVHHSLHNITKFKGRFGYTFNYTNDSNSLKNQIYEKLKKSKILFNEIGDYEILSQKYDYVVIATGDSTFSEEMGCWQEWLKVYIRGCVVLGNFNPNEINIWFNKDYCKNGYAYMIPFDNKKASISLVVPNVNEKEIDHYWEMFMCTENIDYTIVDEYKCEHKSGYVYPLKHGNLIFTGIAGGGLDPFLGFGHFNTITMGVAAARAIAKGQDYEKLVRNIIKKNVQVRQFRKLLDKLDNEGYDNLLSILKLPGMKQLLYDSSINIAKYGSFISKFFNVR